MNRDTRIKSAPQTAMELAFNRAVQQHATNRKAPVFAPCHCGLSVGLCTCKSQPLEKKNGTS